MSHIKKCSYCFKRITKEDIPFQVAGYDYDRDCSVEYDLCLSCRTKVNSFQKTTVYEFIKARDQECCTALGDYCCEDHYPDGYEHDCLHDIKQIVLE